jgi:hypothetical protein
VADATGEDLKLALKKKLTAALPGAAARRHENDRKHQLRDDDGRRRPDALARDEQINFKAPKGTQARMAAIARAQGVSRVAAFMKMLADAEAKLGVK